MHARLTKEVRPLVGPALLGSFCFLACRWLPLGIRNDILTAPLWTLWLGTVSLLASRAFAVEPESHGFALLLSQPVSRGRIWWEKYRVLVPIVLLLSAAFAPTLHFMRPRQRWDQPPWVGLYCSVICSLAAAPYWASVARTTLGAMVLGFGSQIAICVSALVVVETVSGTEPVVLVALLCTAGYVLVFLNLGWRRHARTEAIERLTAFRNEPDLPQLMGRSSARHGRMNLLLRELHLHRSSLTLAGVFVVLLAGLHLLETVSPIEIQQMLTPLIRQLPYSVWGIVTLLFAAATAFSEERALGTHHGSLALPVATHTQFLIKLGTAAAVVLGLGIALPVVTAVILDGPALFFSERMPQESDLPLWQTGMIIVVGFAISVRMATLCGNPLQSVLATIGVLAPTIAVAAVLPDPHRLIYALLPLNQVGMLERNSTWWNLGLATNGNDSPVMMIAFTLVLVTAVGLLALAARDYAQLEPRTSRRSGGVTCGTLIIALSVLVLFARDLEERVTNQQEWAIRALSAELDTALSSLAAREPFRNRNDQHVYTLADLQATGWLKAENAARLTAPAQKIVMRQSMLERQPHGIRHLVSVEFVPAITFPENHNARYQSLRFTEADWIEIPSRAP